MIAASKAGHIVSSNKTGSLHLQIPDAGPSCERYQPPCTTMSEEIVFLNSPQGATPASQYPNKPLFPRDVGSHLDDESVWEEDDSPPSLATSLDLMVLGIGFDCSCLDDLDEKLLVSPIDSFADTCWASAVYDDRSTRTPRRRSAEATPNLGLMRSTSDSDSDDDSATCHGSPTFADFGKVVDSSAAIESFHTHGMPKERALHVAGHHFDDDGEKSLIWMQPHFGTSGPQDSIGYFPISRQNITRKPASRGIERLVTMCSNLIKLPS